MPGRSARAAGAAAGLGRIAGAAAATCCGRGRGAWGEAQGTGWQHWDLRQEGRDILRTGQKDLAFPTGAQPALPPCPIAAILLPWGPLPANNLMKLGKRKHRQVGAVGRAPLGSPSVPEGWSTYPSRLPAAAAPDVWDRPPQQDVLMRSGPPAGQPLWDTGPWRRPIRKAFRVRTAWGSERM